MKKDIVVFFLPKETRPKDMPPLPYSFKGKYWHTGLIFSNKVYETFSDRQYLLSSQSIQEKRQAQIFNQKAVYIDTKFDTTSLMTNLTSGTSSTQYVLRTLGLSRLSGDKPGYLFPEDVYNLLKNKIIPYISFPHNTWNSVLRKLNTKGFIETIRIGNEYNKYKLHKAYNASWNDLLYVTGFKNYIDYKDINNTSNIVDFDDKLDDIKEAEKIQVLKLVRT